MILMFEVYLFLPANTILIDMKRLCAFMLMLLFSVFCFAQQNDGIRVIGRIPDATDNRLYQMQVGAFKNFQNASNAFEKLKAASLNPSYEEYTGLTRVLIKGVKPHEIPSYIERIRRAGFSDVFIKIDPANMDHLAVSTEELPVSTEELPVSTVVLPVSTVALPVSTVALPVSTEELPVSNAALPSAVLQEIAYRSIKVGETKSLADLVTDKNVSLWKSSTPSTISVNSGGVITGLKIGHGYISINKTEYISVVVVPAEDFYIVSASQAAMLPQDSKTSRSSTKNLTEYQTEPTFRLAYRFANKGEKRGKSGKNGGIDILVRGPNYEWLWTTFQQGGWFYDLNGKKREMINGRQKDRWNGVELTVKPEFVYDKGNSSLQLKHILHNPGNKTVKGQRFGASADVMMHNNDRTSLKHTSYGAYMADSEPDPSLELMFVCESGDGINPVDTLWLGKWEGGSHLNYIYWDNRSVVRNADSAIGFSYRNIILEPGQTKEFIVRFTLARTED